MPVAVAEYSVQGALTPLVVLIEYADAPRFLSHYVDILVRYVRPCFLSHATQEGVDRKVGD